MEILTVINKEELREKMKSVKDREFAITKFPEDYDEDTIDVIIKVVQENIFCVVFTNKWFDLIERKIMEHNEEVKGKCTIHTTTSNQNK